MAFAVLVAVDFGSGKVNFELAFQSRPTIRQLRDRIQHDIGAEARARAPGQPFEIYRAQIFDERLQMWVDLMSAGQLEHYCQVYVFQCELPGTQRDRPGRIPPPVRPTAHSGGAGYLQYGSIYPADGEPGMQAPDYPLPPVSVGDMRDARSAGDMRDVRTEHFPSPARTPREMAEEAFPDAAPPQEKARITHLHLQGPGSAGRGFSSSEWCDAMERLGLSGEVPDAALTSATCTELFARADKNGDGVVSAQEWQRFAQLYPKLIDSIYYRSRDRALQDASERHLEQAKQREAELKRTVEAAKAGVDQIEAEQSEAQGRAEEAERACREAQDEEQSTHQAKQDLGPQKDAAQAKLQDARRALATCKDAHRQYEQEQRVKQRAADAAQKRLRQREEEKERAAKEVTRLERLLEQAKQELQRKEEECNKAALDVEDAVRDASVAGAGQEVQQQLRDAGEAVEAAEAELRNALGDERKGAAEHQEAQRKSAQALRHKGIAEREVQQLRQRQLQKEQAVEKAERDLEQQAQAVQRLEEQQNQTQERGRTHVSEENELLRMEIRLQEQRAAMQEKEEHLRSAHRSFCETAGRGSPQRGNYGPPGTTA